MSDFETRSRAALEASVGQLDGRVRSRLTRARHAALDELQRAHRRRAAWWPLLPVATFGAAAVLAIALWTRQPESVAPRLGAPVAQATSALDPQGAGPRLASLSSDEVDFLLGEDIFDAALRVEPVG
ncbi:MAG: hypothetical protein AB7P31_14660 [Steroidobacteraceae bacterium]